jgi:hypothetical protein
MRFAAICAVLWVCATPISAEDRHITVTGQGMVQAQPDQAVISVGAAHRAKSAQDAMDAVNTAVAGMMAALNTAGVEPRDIQTTGIGLHAVHDHNTQSEGGPVLVGFSASNRLTIKVRDIDAAGEVLGALVDAGANDIGGISFGLSDPQEAMNGARRDAVADAQSKAALYAEAAGVALGKVISVREHGGQMPRPEMGRMAMASFDAAAIAPGELSIFARVEMVLELVD